MAAALVNLDIALTDDLRVSPRMGGGFNVHVGPAGQSHTISFVSGASAEAFASLLTLSAVTHGNFGPVIEPDSNVVPLNHLKG